MIIKILDYFNIYNFDYIANYFNIITNRVFKKIEIVFVFYILDWLILLGMFFLSFHFFSRNIKSTALYVYIRKDVFRGQQFLIHLFTNKHT